MATSYSAAFSGVTEPTLRRMLMGDKERDPLTGITFLNSRTWDAVCAIARRDGVGVGGVLARAVRNYVKSEGYAAPPCRGGSVRRPGLVARIAGHFKR